MKHWWVLPLLRLSALAAYIASFYGLLYFSIYSFLGPGAVESVFGPSSILLILVAAPGLPLLRYWLSDRLDMHRRYLTVRWSLMLTFFVLSIPLGLGLIKYDGPYNLVALALGLAAGLVFLAFAVVVALPLYVFATGILRGRPGHVHAGSFLALMLLPLTTFRFFLVGSQSSGDTLVGLLILAGFLLAWDWGDLSAKIARTIEALDKGVVHNPFASGLAVYVPSGIVLVAFSLLLTLAVRDGLVQRTILGGPTSYFHVFFWIGVLAIGILSIGALSRYGRERDEPRSPAS